MNVFHRYTLAIVLLALGSAAFGADKTPPPLSEMQKDAIRHACEHHPATSMSGAPGIPRGTRFLAYEKELGDCHAANRLETLLLLARIVDTGKPQEAVYALANMEALEGNLVGASLTADIPAKYVDRTGADADLWGRSDMVKQATKLLAAAGAPQMTPPTPPLPDGVPQMVPPTPPKP
jgi:hypothetical protein